MGSNGKKIKVKKEKVEKREKVKKKKKVEKRKEDKKRKRKRKKEIKRNIKKSGNFFSFFVFCNPCFF